MLGDYLVAGFAIACGLVLVLLGLACAVIVYERRRDDEWSDLRVIRTYRDDPDARPGIRALYDRPGHVHRDRRPTRPGADRLPPWWSVDDGVPPGRDPLRSAPEALTHA